MKILHLQYELNKTCGITKTIFLLVKYSSKGYQHEVFTFGGDNTSQFLMLGIPVYILRKNRNTIYSSIIIFLNILWICKRNKVDILHAHHRYFDLLAYFVGIFCNIKRITSVHDIVSKRKTISYKSSKLIAVGESVKKHLINYFEIKDTRISVINNFVEIPTPIQLIKKEQITLASKASKIIVFIGRFSKEKGVDILLSAFQHLQNENYDVKLLMIGGGEELNYVKDFIKNNYINAVVLPPQEMITKYYNAADIVVLPSRNDAFPLVMLEAGLNEKIFIGANVDGISEFIEDGYNGLLFAPGNVVELKEKISKVLFDFESALIMGKNLKKKVMKNYTSKHAIPRYEHIYKKLFADDRI